MSDTPNEYLKHANRGQLVLLSDTHFDAHECCETLRIFGSIKKINFSSDFRAAFVKFECEHAPLLVARCFIYHVLTNSDVPIPKGLSRILPGCSVDNFLYLHVPRSLSSTDLNQLISDWTGLDVTVHRGVSFSKPSTRAVVELHGALGAFDKQETDGHPMSVNVRINGSCYCFQAIPHLPQLTDTSDISEKAGCEECNLDALRASMQIEERKFDREFNDVPVPPAPIQVKTSDEEEENYLKQDTVSSVYVNHEHDDEVRSIDGSDEGGNREDVGSRDEVRLEVAEMGGKEDE